MLPPEHILSEAEFTHPQLTVSLDGFMGKAFALFDIYQVVPPAHIDEVNIDVVPAG